MTTPEPSNSTTGRPEHSNSEEGEKNSLNKKIPLKKWKRIKN